MTEHCSLREALQRLTPSKGQLRRSLRSWREGLLGAGRPQGKRASFDRLLARPLRVPAEAEPLLVQLLSAELSAEEAAALLDALERCLWQLWRGRLRLQLSNTPRGWTARDSQRLLGGPLEAERTAAEAAQLIKLSGLIVGGRALQLRALIPEDCLLPSPPRASTRRPPPDSERSLLTDASGRSSLTPAPLAREHAQWLRGLTVLEPFAGCGGDTLALARVCPRVLAWEWRAPRRRWLRENLKRAGLMGRVQLSEADARRELSPVAEALREEWGLMLDPPWGGDALEEQATTWTQLFEGWSLETLEGLMRRARRVVVKAPRTLDLDTLPRGWGWQIRYGFIDRGGGPGASLKEISLLLERPR